MLRARAAHRLPTLCPPPGLPPPNTQPRYDAPGLPHRLQPRTHPPLGAAPRPCVEMEETVRRHPTFQTFPPPLSSPSSPSSPLLPSVSFPSPFHPAPPSPLLSSPLLPPPLLSSAFLSLLLLLIHDRPGPIRLCLFWQDAMGTTVLKVAMMCGGCTGAVERVLGKMEGGWCTLAEEELLFLCGGECSR